MAETGARLLVADDNKVNRLLLSRSLELQGHRVALGRPDVRQSRLGQAQKGQPNGPPGLADHRQPRLPHQTGCRLDHADGRVLNRDQRRLAITRQQGLNGPLKGLIADRLVPRAQVEAGFMAEGAGRALIGDAARAFVFDRRGHAASARA